MKKHRLPKTYNKISYRIPLCSECGEEMVKYRGKWLCNEHMLIPIRGEFGKTEQVPFGSIYKNRQQRREK